MADQPLLLTGIRVVDFSQAAFGPVATRMLADLGADVIKVEPLEGDFQRMSAEPLVDSVTFIGNNLNKRSLAVDLREEQGMRIVRQLCDTADVLVENFRPGVMERLGLGFSDLSQTNPRLVYGSFSMYGDSGPLAHRRGGDMWAQAFAGFIASQTDPTDPDAEAGQVNGHNVIDYGGAAINAFAIMAALWHRERTGVGQEVSNNLVNTAVLLQWPALATYMVEGVHFTKEGRGGVRSRFPYGAYPASDGQVLTIFGVDNTEWQIVCELLGLEHLLQDSRYDSVEQRTERKWELYPVMDEAFSSRTREEWAQLFRSRGLRCDPCLDYTEFVAHPQFVENKLAVTVDDPRDGEITLPASPVRFSAFPAPERARHSPILGEHTRDILLELGYSESDVEELSQQGVVALPIPDMFEARRTVTGRAANRQGGVFRGLHGEQRRQSSQPTT